MHKLSNLSKILFSVLKEREFYFMMRKFFKKKKNNHKATYQDATTRKGANKKGFLELPGRVIDLLPNAMFKVRLENGHEILAHLSGKMRINRIRLITGDQVTIEMSPYDLTKGRVIYRH